MNSSPNSEIRIEGPGRSPYILHCLLPVLIALLLPTEDTDAQTYSPLHHFTSTSGMLPGTPLVPGSNGTLYGMAERGGTSDNGVLFKVQRTGSGFAAMKDFANPAEGSSPRGGLILSGTNLYGTTMTGGSGDGGTIFKLGTNGSGFSVLKQFADSAWPAGNISLSGATIFGTTRIGGPTADGTVFQINTDGTGFLTLKSFLFSDGSDPSSGVILSGDTLYGVTYSGGSANKGVVFKLNTNGIDFTVLKHFTGSDGRLPAGSLLVSGTNLYGTTLRGGNHDWGTVYRIGTDGSGFIVLKHFNLTGGEAAVPQAGLCLGGTMLYGTTYRGGYADQGTVFELDTDGSGFALLKHFTGADGAAPQAALLLSGNSLYGTTSAGGDFGGGVLFKLALPLRLLNPACVNTNFTFAVQSETDANYPVEFNEDLRSTNWRFHHMMTGNGALLPCAIPMTNASQRFFRVRLP